MEFAARYISAVFHSQALQQCWEVSNKEQAGCDTSTCCSSPEERTTEHKHAGICLFPSLQELLCRDWKTNDSLMVLEAWRKVEFIVSRKGGEMDSVF